MSKLFDTLQRVLLADKANHRSLQQRIKKAQESLSGVELARHRLLLRFSLALQDFTEERANSDYKASSADIAVLLRQLIRTYHGALRIKRELWQHIQPYQHQSCLQVTDESDPHTVELKAKAWQPEWLPESKITEIDELVLRRHKQAVVGDGLLYAMTKKQSNPFLTYRSQAQKTALSAALFAPPGSTTLITLPTGGGKSLSVILPAWLESHGGRRKGGTTLVIVPTVALAYDQQDQVRRYFAAASEEYKPFSLTSDTPPETRATIYNGIKQGTLPILYTSPEGLLRNWALYDTCLQAAQNSTLTRLVIDEAHLVKTWGTKFRTDFQLLSAYRRRLLEASGGKVRTLLLSATVSYKTQETLARLFGNHDELSLVLGNQIRPEPTYWFARGRNQRQRRDYVLEALFHLPRPAILYVTKPRDADNWVARLRRMGFNRVAAFSGQTPSDERQRLIRAWNNNQLDIMVGTSAFGLGVDKPDIRTIIHATLPQNIDRFYQEVGRGGRDGCSAISLLCTTRKDEELAFSMTTRSHITIEKAWPRWQGMWHSGRPYGEQGDAWLININALPLDKPEMKPNQANRGWNEHILLLLQRAGAIIIEDTRPEESSPEKDSLDDESQKNHYSLLVRVLSHDIVKDEQAFCRLFAPLREEEKETIHDLLQRMNQLVRSMTRQPEECIAYDLSDLYPATALACGGCPSCRQQQRSPYVDEMQVDLELDAQPPSADYLEHQLRQRLGERRSLNVVSDKARTLDSLKTFADLIITLVGAGIQQVLLPDELLSDIIWANKLVKGLGQHQRIPHRVLTTDWLIDDEEGQELYPLPTVVLYPPDDRKADQLYQTLQPRLRHAKGKEAIWQIHVVHRSLWLASQNGRFLDRIEGLQLMPTELERLLKKSQRTLL